MKHLRAPLTYNGATNRNSLPGHVFQVNNHPVVRTPLWRLGVCTQPGCERGTHFYLVRFAQIIPNWVIICTERDKSRDDQERWWPSAHPMRLLEGLRDGFSAGEAFYAVVGEQRAGGPAGWARPRGWGALVRGAGGAPAGGGGGGGGT